MRPGLLQQVLDEMNTATIILGVLLVDIIETWELLHQKQSKFAFSEPPLVDDIINHVLENHSGLWSNIVYILFDHRPGH